MLKKILLVIAVLVTISIVYVGSLILFKDYIFLTKAGFDGEPHKATYFFWGWGILLVTGFILSLKIFNKKRK